MDKQLRQSARDDLRQINGLATATDLWVRQRLREQQFVGEPTDFASEDGIAAGFLAGLAAVHDLGDEELLWVAYAYALKRNPRADSVAHAQALQAHVDALHAVPSIE